MELERLFEEILKERFDDELFEDIEEETVTGEVLYLGPEGVKGISVSEAKEIIQKFNEDFAEYGMEDGMEHTDFIRMDTLKRGDEWGVGYGPCSGSDGVNRWCSLDDENYEGDPDSSMIKEESFKMKRGRVKTVTLINNGEETRILSVK